MMHPDVILPERSTAARAQQPVILIIEDDRQLRRLLSNGLTEAGYKVYASDAGRRGIAEISRRQADLVILDLGLPDMDGMTVIQEVRGWSPVPLLVLSSRQLDTDKIAALNAGADDYLSKPFSFGELQARVAVALRRRRQDTAELRDFQVGELQVNFMLRTVKVAGQPIHLAPIEFQLLAVLARNAGRITPHRTLLQAVWGPQHVDDAHYLRVHISNLRKKLERNPLQPRYLLTEPTIGYRIAAE